MPATYSRIQNPERLDLVRRAMEGGESPLLDHLTRVTSRALGSPFAAVSFVGHDRQFFKSVVGLSEPWVTRGSIPIEYSLCRHAVEGGRPLVVTDAESDMRVRCNPSVTQLGVRAYAGVPLRSGSHTLGTLNVVDYSPRAWSTDDLRILTDLAGAVMVEIANQLRTGGTEDRYEKALRALEQRTRILCHDLRSPLSVIYATAHLLLELPLDEEQRSSHLQRVGHVSMQMERLVHDLLEPSRLESDPLLINREPCDMVQILADVELVMRPLAEGAGVDLRTRVSRTSHPLRADPMRVYQVLANLVANALKFSLPTTAITVRVRNSRSGVRVSVRDQGPGIPLEDQEKIWIRGWQANSDDNRGVGLGLTMAKEIVEGHGGEIGVMSRPGGGSLFWVELPTDAPRNTDRHHRGMASAGGVR